MGRQIVSPRVELDREVQRRVGPEQRGEQVGHRQDARADRAGLPAEPARGRLQDAILDVGAEDPGGQPLGGPDGVVEPHDQVARVERHARDVRVEPVEQAEQFVDGQVGVGLDRDLDAPLAEPRGEPVRGRRRSASIWSAQGVSRRKRSWRSPTKTRACVQPSAATPSTCRARSPACSPAETCRPSSRDRRTGLGEGRPTSR